MCSFLSEGRVFWSGVFNRQECLVIGRFQSLYPGSIISQMSSNQFIRTLIISKI